MELAFEKTSLFTCSGDCILASKPSLCASNRLCICRCRNLDCRSMYISGSSCCSGAANRSRLSDEGISEYGSKVDILDVLIPGSIS